MSTRLIILRICLLWFEFLTYIQGKLIEKIRPENHFLINSMGTQKKREPLVVAPLSRLSHLPCTVERTTNRAHADMIYYTNLHRKNSLTRQSAIHATMATVIAGCVNNHIPGHLSLSCLDGTWNLRDFESQAQALINAFNMSTSNSHPKSTSVLCHWLTSDFIRRGCMYQAILQWLSLRKAT